MACTLLIRNEIGRRGADAAGTREAGRDGLMDASQGLDGRQILDAGHFWHVDRDPSESTTVAV